MRTVKYHTMRQLLTLILVLSGLGAFTQQYNNEWIRYDQTYYKFKIAKKGLFRISKTELDNLGIGNTPVQNFELWRNGQRVAFYPSVTSGTLPAGGYLEFWGSYNDGVPDRDLYRDPSFQHSTETSLLTDTAAYFLSVNSDQSGFIVSNAANNVAGNTLPVEPYFMYNSGAYFKNRINLGFAAVVGEYVYSSSYDKGEFWSTGNIAPSSTFIHSKSNLFVYGAGPASTLRFGSAGGALNPRTVRATVNGTVVKDTLMDYFNDLKTEAQFSTSLIGAGNSSIQFSNTSAITTDRIVISFYELIYPRLFNFGNQNNFEFVLPADVDGYYLEISNFNRGNIVPYLYDLTNGLRYPGDISTAGLTKFALPPSASEIKYVLVSEENSNLNNVGAIATRNFVRFLDAANQGDYLIITHPSLYAGTGGRNPIEEYRDYRSSTVGGQYNAHVYDINELEDQFGYGIKKNPLGIRNFIRFARDYFPSNINNIFLIGRGMTYNEYRTFQSDPIVEKLNLVPTFGTPASDNLLTSIDLTTSVPLTPIGRLSVIYPHEVEDYLEKVIEYEDAQRNSPNTIAGRDWMKNVVHVTGASDPYLGVVLCNYMSTYKQLAEDTMFGGKVSTFCKNTTNPIEQLTTDKIAGLFAEGISVLTYFGHSSSTTLEFNLDNPQAYSNQGKYPVFYVNGCNAGNFFTYYPQRLQVNETLSEKFVLAKQRGSIAFIASTHYGIVNYLNLFLNGLYTTFGNTGYGNTIGQIQKESLQKMVTATGVYDYYSRMHAEEIALHGDPALRLNVQPKPDFVIEEPLIKVDPTFISVAENSFQLKVKTINIGKAVNDSVVLEIKRQYPDGSTFIIYRQAFVGVHYMDSVVLNVPIVATRDKGSNKLIVTIDADLKIDEIAENNNTATKEFFVYEDEARPIYPYNYAIINTQSQHLFASTANPFSPTKDYILEVDTTEKFNSTLKVTKTQSAPGGVVEFVPGINYLDSTVYYWRVALVPAAGGEPRWNNSSFMYINGPEEGVNQSHYFQHTKSELTGMSIDSVTRKWKFSETSNNFFMRNGVFPTAANQAGDFAVSVNGQSNILSVCGISNIIVNVFDPITVKPWFNANVGAPTQYGSDPICGNDRRYNFQYNILDTNKRRKLVEFLDLIPAGHYVVVRNTSGTVPNTNTYAAQWQGDTSYLGSNNSIYHRLLQQGFTGIDSFNVPRAFIFIYRKDNQATFTPAFTFSQGVNDRITLSKEVLTPDTLGYILSPRFGPAKQWRELVWDGTSMENPSDDDPTIDVIGVDTGFVETPLFRVDKNTKNFDLSLISAEQFPWLRLKMRNIDSTKLTPFQLKFWRIYYTPVPEGSIAPNLFFTSKDSLEVGEMLKFGVAFKNISKAAFDSIKVKVVVIDKNNVQHLIDIPRQRPIVSGDSIVIRFDLDTRNFTENNTLLVDVNPDNDQPEQYHFNNFLYRDFYVKPDRVNPFLDVTFDGVHILNRDIVSAKPHILIKLKDNAKFLLLNDTALNQVQLRYPDGTLRTFAFDNDTLRFTPATTGDNNTATIDFLPQFSSQANPEGDEYELIVKGKDQSGNKSGELEYRVTFRVITKPMISNMLNYPNPFSTSTAFVFTLTGSQVPSNIKIQILTVTGKIVREITKDELGPIHIGRNITEFKWDGTDQYGQKLGNGVYLYRVVTTMNGKPMEKYKAEGDNTDKFFNNGYGKMYLMR